MVLSLGMMVWLVTVASCSHALIEAVAHWHLHQIGGSWWEQWTLLLAVLIGVILRALLGCLIPWLAAFLYLELLQVLDKWLLCWLRFILCYLFNLGLGFVYLTQVLLQNHFWALDDLPLDLNLVFKCLFQILLVHKLYETEASARTCFVVVQNVGFIYRTKLREDLLKSNLINGYVKAFDEQLPSFDVFVLFFDLWALFKRFDVDLDKLLVTSLPFRKCFWDSTLFEDSSDLNSRKANPRDSLLFLFLASFRLKISPKFEKYSLTISSVKSKVLKSILMGSAPTKIRFLAEVWTGGWRDIFRQANNCS